MQALNNKITLITGAGSGIGRALAIQLANQDCKLILTDINNAALQETATLLPNTGELLLETLDVASLQQWEQLKAKTMATYKHVDILINNAGVALCQPFSDMSLENLDWLMNVNFKGVVFGCKVFLPLLEKSPDAHIVNISSVFGMIGVPTQSAYNASKFAVRGLTESLHQELHETPINVSCIYPGGIKTNIVKNARYFEGPDGITNQQDASSEFANIAMTTAEKAASTILKGILKNKKRILIGPDARAIDWMQRLLPNSYDKLLRLGLKGKQQRQRLKTT
ncbi:SDR family NAD(P)-dependent oxidoreductase [Kistimonas asteriae]|uniref:SDR family NAD(P)-dependent oxidoreductase n=1 Tax=Kistimonas asteriae TaxID=517724 RepID=UPI001BAC34C3|nr:SDR family oxidoreductase [Kistimonas asteriae]